MNAHYEYNLRNDLISLTDAEGHTRRFTYDKNRNKLSEIKHMGQVFTYTYDAVGNLATEVDAKGQMTVYEYDAAGRKTAVNYYSASDQTTPVKKVTFAYDELGNMIFYNDNITSATYAYNELNRKASEAVNFGNFSLSYSYAYNPTTRFIVNGPMICYNRSRNMG